MWELDYKESWAAKNWCFWTVVLEETLESPLDCKEIQPVNAKGNQSLKIHWKDWCWSWNSNTLATWCKELTQWKTLLCWERLTARGEGGDRGWDGWMASPLNGLVFERALGVGDGQGGLACCSPCCHKELDMTEWPNNNSNWVQQPWTLAIALSELPLEFYCYAMGIPILHGNFPIFYLHIFYIGFPLQGQMQAFMFLDAGFSQSYKLSSSNK